MADTAEAWLERWADAHLDKSDMGKSDMGNSDMQAHAKACAADATAAGYTIADLKAAAGGDLETYLVGRQSAREAPRGGGAA